MRDGPDISRIAALLGDPGRAAMLTALLSGKALTAGELAHEAGVTPATASGHLAQLAEAGLVRPWKQGRHRYFALDGPEVAGLLETLAGLAVGKGLTRTRTGPRDAALRECRVCYDHLAGARAVQLYSSLAGRGFLAVTPETVAVTAPGEAALAELGLDLAPWRARKRAFCRLCLDWSERRPHLGGALGAALLDFVLESGWARRARNDRRVVFSPEGGAAFDAVFPAAESVTPASI
ncbi:MAG: winged helix-turn-helix domain-containing protein [Pseudomonadota bacterium]